ncbi:MFS general substrate transporter [Meredithblackwellia eburnea MCA 4105]
MSQTPDNISEKEKDLVVPTAQLAGLDEDEVREAERSALRAKYSYADSKRLLRKVDWRLLPMLWFMYLIKNLDVNLVSYVKTMDSGEPTNALKMLKMSTDDWSYLSTIYTAALVVTEIPATMLIKKFTPRLHFTRIMALWSICTICAAACTNKTGFYICRFFLGVFESGLWPGIIYQLSLFYRPDEIAVRLASINMLGQFSGILIAFETYGLQFVKGKLAGWQWAYIIEGLLGLVMCLIVYLWLPDYPDSPQGRRQFLSEEEGAFLVARLPANTAKMSDEDFSWDMVKVALKDPLTYSFGLILLFQNTGTSGYQFWLPSIISGYHFTSKTSSQLLNIPPAVLYVMSALGWGWVMDNIFWIPKPTVLIGAQVGIIGCLIGLTWCTSNAGKLFFILFAAFSDAAYFGNIFPWRLQSFKGSTHATFSISLMIAVANASSLYTAQIFRAKYAPKYVVPYMISVGFLVLTILMLLYCWKITYKQEKEHRAIAQKRHDEGKRSGRVLDEDVSKM